MVRILRGWGKGMIPWTKSTASNKKIAIFTAIMGGIAMFINTIPTEYHTNGTGFGMSPGINQISWIFVLIVAITMGPIWGILAALIRGFSAILDLKYLPFLAVLLNIVVYDVIPTGVVGFLALKVRPIWAILLPWLPGFISILMWTLHLLQSPVIGYPIDPNLVVFIVTYSVGLNIAVFLVTWVCVRLPQIWTYFPGYTYPKYGRFLKIEEAQPIEPIF